MILKKVKCEVNDPESRFLLKRICTSEGDDYNRIIPVSNKLYYYEKQREEYKKNGGFDSLFQTLHIRWDKYDKEWDYDNFESSKNHAIKNGRIFIPHQQRNQKNLNKLTWQESEGNFIDLLNKGSQFIPYYLPTNASLKDWLKRKKDALSLLNKTQRLIPTFSAKHSVKSFKKIIEHEIKQNQLIGVQSYSLTSPKEIANLSFLRKANASFNEGDECPLIIYFNQPRYIVRFSRINSSFIYSCFAGDVFSQRAYFPKYLPKECWDDIKNGSPADNYFFDSSEGAYSKPKKQKKLYGLNLNETYMKEIDTSEGLTGLQVLNWVSKKYEYRTLKLLNNELFRNKSIIEYIKQKRAWAEFWAENINIV